MTAHHPIGVFDSGVGGLTVLAEIRRELPAEDLLYVADSGHAPYGDKSPTLIEAREETVRTRPDLVQRFVDASIIGWTNYLYGDHRGAHALILRENPEMTQGELEASLALLKSQGIVDSGETLTQGIGAMNPERIRAFYEAMVTAGLYRPADVDLSQVADTRFVGKGVGLDVKERLTGPTGIK